MMFYSLYIIINKINGKKYIGYTSRTIEARFKEHCKVSTRGKISKISAAIQKYGKDNFEVRPISHAPTAELAKEFEKRLIKIFETFGKKGYNKTKGGDGSGPHTEEYKQYMSKLLKGRTFTDEWRLKISNKKKGTIPGNKDKSKFPIDVVEKLKDRQFFENCIEQGLSSKDVSVQLGVHDESVRRYAKKLGITFPKNTDNTKRKISLGVLANNSKKNKTN